MKKKLFIKDLLIGDSIFSEKFALKSYVRKASRNNKPYIDIELADKTGAVKGKIWSDNFSGCDIAKEGDVVLINATVDDYQGPQLNVTNLKIATDYDVSEFQQTTAFDIETMWADVNEVIQKTKNPHVKGLLNNVFNQETVENFKKSSAAYRVHHAYIGGLLEHTWEMLKMAEALKSHYPNINMDIVNAGIILHDIGKIFEYELTTVINISDEGKLIGHIFIGAELVKNAMPKETPKDLANEIIHIVLSHHGEKELGSPVLPMTTEAFAVNALDVASSKINIAYTNIHGSLGSDRYTPYISQLKTELYRSPYLSNLENEDIPF